VLIVPAGLVVHFDRTERQRQPSLVERRMRPAFSILAGGHAAGAAGSRIPGRQRLGTLLIRSIAKHQPGVNAAPP
jgi:hypothetical protein